MGKLLALALRVVLALALAGSLFVQLWMVPLLSVDLQESGTEDRLRMAVLATVVLGIACGHLTLVCVWRLLTLVRRGTVFSTAAFEAKHLRTELDEVI